MRLLLVTLIACGGSTEPTAPRTGPVASAIATPRGADDVIVAHVNGRPIYASCVAAQARSTTPAAKRVALDECLAFELLAQAADARGLAADPGVIDATRTALVDRLVETGFEQRYRTPQDLAEIIDAHIDRNKERLSRPEGRASAYIRVPLPSNAPPADDWAARQLAEAIANKLAGEVGLLPAHLDAAGKELAGGRTIEFAEVRTFGRAGLHATYADALFAIPEVGRIAPKAVKTKWGWDVILLTEIGPAKSYTREDAAAEAFPELRRGYFQIWVNQIVRSLGVTIKIDDKQVAKLDEVGL
jgi:hypothetical protein